MDREEIIRKLIRYGHLQNVQWSELSTLSIHDDRVDGAIASYRWYTGLSESVPVEEAFKVERCGCPDILPAQLNSGSGSWPTGCNPEFPKNHTVVYKVDKSRMPSYLKDTFEESWNLMTQAYANVGLMILRADVEKHFNSLVTFESGRGWLGLAIVGKGQRCSTKMWAKFDTSYGKTFGKDKLISQWAFLLAHELGHNCGLGHTRGGIMNASLINGTFHPDQWRRNDPAFPTHTRWYGGNPIEQDPIWTIPQPEHQS
jgi:hypothetical protein